MGQENFTENHRNIQFSNDVTATLREMPGSLFNLCGTTKDYRGAKAARIENRFDRLVMEEQSTRNGDTNTTDLSSAGRFIVPGRSANVAQMLDEDDVEVSDVSYGSAIVQQVADAAATYHDDMWSKGYFGAGWTGEAGNVQVPFKATNIIPHGGVGLTQAKLLALRETMRKRYINFNRVKPVIVLLPEDETALFNIPEYKSFDWNGGKPLPEGEIKPWLGFRFVTLTVDVNTLPKTYQNWFTDAGVTRQLPAFDPAGMHRGVWEQFRGRISEMANKNYNQQYWGEARSACVRTDEDRCFLVQTR